MDPTAVPPDTNQWLPATDRIGGFAQGLVVAIGILLLITTITITSYCLTRSHIFASSPRTIRRRQRQTNATSGNGDERFHFGGDDQNDTVVVEVLGLDDEVIKSFPKGIIIASPCVWVLNTHIHIHIYTKDLNTRTCNNKHMQWWTPSWSL